MADRVASLLRPLCPVFAVPAHNIHFVREPGAYLATLERLIGGAKRRVALSGLYLGSDALSHRLVSAARARLDAPAPPAMSLLLDHGRGLRRDGIATSVDTAAPLLARGASVALWQTPHMRGWKGALPVRLRELGGVQHMKVHVVDDAVVISGANMAASYFSTRQDRYVVIDDAAVSAFFLSLLDAVGRHSWHIAPDKGLTAPSPHAHRELAREIEALFSASLGRPLASGAIDDADTVFVAPTVQAGPLGIRVDEHATRALLHELRDWSHVSMASGYFNLTRQVRPESIALFVCFSCVPSSSSVRAFVGASASCPHHCCWSDSQPMAWGFGSLAPCPQRLRSAAGPLPAPMQHRWPAHA